MKKFFSALICFVLVFQLLGIDQVFALDEESTPDESEIVVTEGTMDLKNYGLDSDDFYSKMLVDMKVTGSKKAELTLDLNLNNAFLNQKMDDLEEKINNKEIIVETPEEPHLSDFGGDEDNPAYQDAMNKYLVDLYNCYSDEDLPTKGFQITLDGSVFGDITTATDVKLSFDDAGRERPIGTYSIEKNSDGNYVLSVNFNKVIYGFSDVHAVICCVSTLKNVDTEKQDVYLKLIPPKKMISVEIKDKEEPVKPAKGAFTISKTAPETVSTPYIDYTIVVNVKDGSFDNTKVVDNIPEGLYVKRVELDGTELEESDYTIDEGVFEYIFHEADPTKVYANKQKTLKLRCYLTAENYTLYASSSSVFVKNFTNETYLKAVKDNKRLTDPAYANTKMSATFLKKTGISKELYGTRFDWTIDVNSYFSDEMTGYLVDKIDKDTHNYAFVTDSTESIVVSQLKAGEWTEVETKVKPVKIDKTTKYEELSMEILDEYTKVPGDSDERQSVYYDYVGEGGKTESIFIIPFDSYVNSKVSLRYQTIRNTHGVPEKDFKDTANVVCSNVAQMIWKFKENVGGGPLPEYKIECNKDISSKVALVQKKNYKTYKNLGYRWLICVNELGNSFTDIHFEDIKIEDVLLNNVQIYPKYIREDHEPLKAHYKAVLNDKNEFEDLGEEVTIPYVDQKVDGKPYYTLENVLVSGGQGTKLTIFIPKVDETENYFIELPTRMSAPEFFKANASWYDLNNKIIWTAITNSKKCWGDSMAFRSPKCNLIQKEGITTGNSYDYKDNTTKWRTTLNHDQEAVTNAALEEVLPEGAVFHEMKEIVIYDTDNKTALYQLTSDDGKLFRGKDNVEYTAEVKDDQTYTLVLPNGQIMSWKEGESTKVLTAYDNLTVADNKLNVTFSGVTKNKISYTFTTQYEKEYRKKVLANKIYPTKCKVNFSGEVEEDPFVMDYVQDELKINPIVLQKEGIYNEELGMVKWNIYLNQAQVDLEGYTVKDAIKDIFDLESDSFRVFQCGVESDSSLKVEKEISGDVLSSFTTEDKNGFTFDIPDEYSDDTLLIQYDTYLCANITKELATNKAILDDDKGIYRETDDVMPKNMKDFNIMNFVLASPYNTLFIEKVSTNQNPENRKLTLPNCEFRVVQMNNEDGKWVESKSYKKFRTTKDNGIATFLNMKKDVLYKIEEVSGIDGYKLMKEPKYLVFKTDVSAPDDYPIGTNTLRIPCEKKFLNMPIENVPIGELEFRKVNEKKAPIMGAEFVLKSVDSKVKEKTAVSDANGFVKFEQLDPGKYVLSETKAPYPYEIFKDVAVEIVAKKNGFTTDIEKQAFISTDETGVTYMVDKVASSVGIIEGKKVDEKGMALEGAEIGLYQKDSITNALTLLKNVISETDGSFSFVGISEGDYVIKEISAPKDYETVDKQIFVHVPSAGGIVEKDTSGKEIIIVNRKISDLKNVANDVAGGFIYVKKVDAKDRNKVLTNAVFSIYEKKSDGIGRKICDLVYDGVTKRYCLPTESLVKDKDGKNYIILHPKKQEPALIFGQYYIVETKAPDYYKGEQTPYLFSIASDGEEAAIASKVDNVFENEPVLGSIQITKTSEDGRKGGFSFRIVGTAYTGEAFKATYQTDANGNIEINDLRSGTYTISEVQNNETEDYVIPQSRTVKLDGGLKQIAFYNKLKKNKAKDKNKEKAKNKEKVNQQNQHKNGEDNEKSTNKSSDDSNNSSDGRNNYNTVSDNQKTDTNSNGQVPKTGDKSMPIWVYLLLSIASLCGIFAIGRKMLFHKS